VWAWLKAHPVTAGALALGGLALLAGGTVKTAALVKKGKALATFTIDGRRVLESLTDVRLQVSKALGRPVSDGLVWLATLIASEAGPLPEIGQVAVAYAALNQATKRKPAGMTRQGREAALLSIQGRSLGENGDARWYAALSKPPTSQSIAVGEKVLGLKVPDPAGAVQWDSPRSQRALHARDPKRYRTPEEIADRRRTLDKRQLVVVAGVDPDRTRFWA